MFCVIKKTRKFFIWFLLSINCLIPVSANDYAYDVETISYVQEYLNSNGYDCGPVDGEYGEKTKKAVIAYQTEHSVDATGVITEQLLKEIEENNSDIGKEAELTEEFGIISVQDSDISQKVDLMCPAVQAYASLNENGEVGLSFSDEDRFWNMIYMFGIFRSQYDLKNNIEKDSTFLYSDDEIAEIAYSIFPDFEGSIPAFKVDPSRGREIVDGKYYLAPATPQQQQFELLSYRENEDSSVDAAFSLSYGGVVDGAFAFMESSRHYVHMIPNSMVNDTSPHPLYYRIVAMSTEKTGINPSAGKEADGSNYPSSDMAAVQDSNTQPGMPSSDIESFKKAYIEVINGQNTVPNGYKYYLIYVNDDSVPELVIDVGYRAGGCAVFTYNEAENTASNIGLIFPFKYLARENLVIWQDIYTGGFRDYEWEIQNGEWNPVVKGDIYTGRGGFRYLVDGTDVDENEYNNMKNQYFGDGIIGKAIIPESAMTYFQILEYLNK